MFIDSPITSLFKLGELKSSYLIYHRVAPYLNQLLSDKIKGEPNEFVLLFDKGMKSKMQNKHIWVG